MSAYAGAEHSARLAPLRAPLVVKLAGANLGVVALLWGAWLIAGGEPTTPAALVVGVVVLVHFAMMLIALRPIRDLESVAQRVWNGDFAARVAESSVADAGALRVGSMFNLLLDSLDADRLRLRTLAADVMDAGDRDRAKLARELHDSAAQHVAALMLQLSTVARDAANPALAQRLVDARDAAEGILEELRLLSHTVHPSVLDDLGLEAAVRQLARDTSNATGIAVRVGVRGFVTRAPRGVEAILYRVADEAVRNAVRHGAPRQVSINLHRDGEWATVDVHDDGRGFDLTTTPAAHGGVGLASARERVAIAGGHLDLRTAAGAGTTLSATVPLDAPEDAIH